MKRPGCLTYAIGGFALLVVFGVIGNLRQSGTSPTPTTATTAQDVVAPPAAAPEPPQDTTLSDLDEAITTFGSRAEFSSKDEAMVGAEGLQALRRALAQADATRDPSSTLTPKALRQKLSRIQVQQYPKLRRAWVAGADQALWENDMDVTCVNRSCTTVQFVGAALAANRNKQTLQNSIHAGLVALRVKQVRMKWMEAADEYSYWQLDVPPDADVAP
jgi:hypothetical protein